MLYPGSPIPVVTSGCRGCVELAHSKRLNVPLLQPSLLPCCTALGAQYAAVRKVRCCEAEWQARLEQDLRDAHKAIARLNEMILSHQGLACASLQTYSVRGFPAPAALEHHQSCMSEPAEWPAEGQQQLKRQQQLASLFDAMDVGCSGLIHVDEVWAHTLLMRTVRQHE